MNKKYFLILGILLVLPLLFAQTHKQNVKLNLKFPFEVNGSVASSSALCNVSVDYPDGTYLRENASATNRNNGDFNITFLSSEINQLGEYEWRAFCCDGSECAGGYGNFWITTTGEKVSLSNIIIVIVFVLMALFFLYLGSIFEKDKWIVKTAFYIFAILMGLLAVNSARIIASESTNLSTMGMSGFLLMIAVLLFMLLYILITATINVFKQVKNKREVRWNY